MSEPPMIRETFSSRRYFLKATSASIVTILSANFLLRFTPNATAHVAYDVSYSDAEWRERLTSSQYAVLRQGYTESPFSSSLDKENRAGTFICAGCGVPLFSSKTKFNSHTGWPSFWSPLRNAVDTRQDRSIGVRTEVHCHRCGGHLGQVFNDGPPPTGLRYCMNGLSMNFISKVA